MTNYYERKFNWDNPNMVSQYDDLPLWSSYFGHLLLDNVPLKKYRTYLDVACGTGFPLIDLCQKIGNGCKGYGIDPWSRAAERIRMKLAATEIKNIEVIESSAETIPFDDGYFDLITSNVGINNFAEPEKVLKECWRVLHKHGTLCITSNLTGTFQEFYNVFHTTLIDLGMIKYDTALQTHIDHRGTVSSFSIMVRNCGFSINKTIESSFSLRFLNGTAFLNHHFIVCGFMDPWCSMFSPDERDLFFKKFEFNLNKYSDIHGEFKVSIPMVYMECVKK